MNKKIFLAVDKEYIHRLFCENKKIFFPEAKGDISEIRIKRVSPDWAKGNCLARYEIFWSNGRKIVLRGTADAEKSKKDVWLVMRMLWNNGFNKGKYRIAKPVACLSKINLLLYREAPGQSLSALIQESSQKDIKKYLSLAAAWLAKLHSFKIAGRKIAPAIFLGLDGYAKIMRKASRYFPELKSKIVPVESLKFLDNAWRENMTLIHNDFYPGNFVIGGSGCCGIDFDKTGKGPYLMDLATIIMALEFPQQIWPSKISPTDAREYQKIFLENYCRLRKISKNRVSRELEKFYVKILLDQVNYFASFAIKGLKNIKRGEKEKLVAKMAILLSKIKKRLEKI